MPVQKAAAEFGIPSGTLYGRCKKVGIELSKNTQVSVSPDTCPPNVMMFFESPKG